MFSCSRRFSVYAIRHGPKDGVDAKTSFAIKCQSGAQFFIVSSFHADMISCLREQTSEED